MRGWSCVARSLLLRGGAGSLHGKGQLMETAGCPILQEGGLRPRQ